MKTLKPRSTENVKHSPTVRQINVNPHTKNLFTSVPIPDTTSANLYINKYLYL